MNNATISGKIKEPQMEAEIDVQIQSIDDIPLIIEISKQMKLAELVEKHFATHGNQEGLNNGQLLAGWLSFILSQSNHCKNAVRSWSNKIPTVLGALLGNVIREVEFSDDRLANLLDKLSDDESWYRFEDDFSKHTIETYELPVETIRCDGSAACGYHEVIENGIMQYGRSKDHRPDLPQLKMMTATLDPGILIGIDIDSGEKNDDSMYLPLIYRIRPMINKKGTLFVGDCKMSSFGIRSDVQQNQDYYLTPLAMGTEKIRLYFQSLVEAIVNGNQEAELVYKENKDVSKLIVAGYEIEREERCNEKQIKWTERIFVYRSFEFAKSEITLFEKKMKKMEMELLKLTPTPIKGSRQFYEESKLVEAINKIINKYEMSKFIKVKYKTEPYNKKNRYVIHIEMNEAEVEEEKRRCGWKLMVTNAPKEKLSLSQAILNYRQEWTLERCFRILKTSHLGISPLYLRKQERLKGITRLLSIGIRLITLLEYNISKNLKMAKETVKGLDVAHPNKTTSTPTAYSIFKKFCREKINLSQVNIEEKNYWSLSKIDEDLIKVLNHLKIPIELYKVEYYRSWHASN